MRHSPRRARVTALAKLNLDLRVLGRRPDGYHELRTVLQTISLCDTIDISYTPGRDTRITLEDELQIPENLVERAAALLMQEMHAGGRVEMRLRKRIPMGGGLGGGSSDAAAVLLALPVLAGRAPALPRLLEIAARLGSDVPFFLLGGTAAGIGRGTEVFPLPDARALPGVVVSTGVAVSTREAYAALGPRLTIESEQNKIVSFQSRLWSAAELRSEQSGSNDFESVVLAQYPRLAAVKRRLQKLGASPAMMTGSGAALFGLFRTREDAARAIRSLGQEEEQIFAISLVNRRRYRAMWWRQLDEHLVDKQWPPRSRYVR